MKCPDCGAECKVLESRMKQGRVYRRLQCKQFGRHHRFSTYELTVAELNRISPGMARQYGSHHDAVTIARKLRVFGLTDTRIEQLTGVKPHELEGKI